MLRSQLKTTHFFLVIFLLLLPMNMVLAEDLDHVLENGTLRHLGIPYANFVHSNHSGLDVELMKGFAKHLGVKYKFVESSWATIIPDLTGKKVVAKGNDVEILGDSPVRGDVIATGFTTLPWREKIVTFSRPTFPSGIWVISRADSDLTPVSGTDSVDEEIAQVKTKLKNHSLLAMGDSCLAPELYGLKNVGVDLKMFDSDRDLGEMIPAVMARMADATLMDVPVALIALEDWPGDIKVIGPVSPTQYMGCAFAKDSPRLVAAFNAYLDGLFASGAYQKMVKKYYPTVFSYYDDFFR
ncbi:MAG: transporter substrate-binding domain-containing protein [Desulfuromusa sp.]|nr:transporter substrate-binding domain-containing protein [Desulfuromusa sp.]